MPYDWRPSSYCLCLGEAQVNKGGLEAAFLYPENVHSLHIELMGNPGIFFCECSVEMVLLSVLVPLMLNHLFPMALPGLTFFNSPHVVDRLPFRLTANSGIGDSYTSITSSAVIALSHIVTSSMIPLNAQ